MYRYQKLLYNSDCILDTKSNTVFFEGDDGWDTYQQWIKDYPILEEDIEAQKVQLLRWNQGRPIYLDDTKYLKWIFFSNKSLVLEKNSEEDLSLFGLRNTASNEMNLLSQQKSVDYFLIIENIVNKKYVDKVLKKISEISGVITSFISENRLENKENLIFS